MNNEGGIDADEVVTDVQDYTNNPTFIKSF